MNRRELVVGAAAGALALGSGGLVETLRRRSTFGYDGLEVLGEGVERITPNEKFYVVTKNLIDPRVDRESWRLELSGLVGNPVELDFEAITNLKAVNQETTLECISNGVGAGLISNAVWRGIPLRELIGEARPEGRARRVFFHASDGFTHSTSLEKALEPTTLLAWEMNGEPLPDRHGYPARLIVPGAYGELSVKWIDRIELIDDDREGYYEKQGWKAERAHTMSRIDVPAERATVRGRTELRGVAFAGDRGISKVEVSTDGGERWNDAEIDYHPSKLTWAHWSFGWSQSAAGPAELVVRATDGEGELQSAKKESSVPDGATGLHRVPVRVES
ncbi:MAG: molybdopterin-dependent oxidoreductase [Actinobacteria bacterium]|nr:molybdopterin-dependent oxidoreductase [Actinomycetota bacterium]